MKKNIGYYAIRAFVLYFGLFTGGLGLVFLNLWAAHLTRRDRKK